MGGVWEWMLLCLLAKGLKMGYKLGLTSAETLASTVDEDEAVGSPETQMGEGRGVVPESCVLCHGCAKPTGGGRGFAWFVGSLGGVGMDEG